MSASPSQMRATIARRRAMKLALRYAAALALLVLFLFPIYWLFAMSLKTADEIFASPPVWIPESIQFDNFRILFPFFYPAIFGTIIMTLIMSVSTMRW